MTPVSRREFFRASALVGAGLALPPLAASCSTPNTVSASALDDLGRLLPGRIVLPGDRDYAKFVTPWNLQWESLRPKAQAVVRATTAEDVATAVKWARRTGTPLVARSGGHSYAGYSTTSGIVIDVSNMRTVDFDAGTGVAALGGGVRNTNAYEALAKVDRTITHGRCLQVGYAGLVLGGGVGFNMRRLGLTCDQLLETTVVLATGDVVRVSPDENSDLLWASQGGGGGNFGIHTSFVTQTQPAPRLTIFDILWTDKLDQVLPELFRMTREAPRELGAKITVRATPAPTGGPTISVGLLGQFVGSLADTEALLAPVRAIARPASDYGFIREAAYWDGQKPLSDDGASEFMAERSHFIRDPLTTEAVGTIFDWLRRWPTLTGVAQWKGFLTGGAVNDVPADATAFVHRDSWLMSTVDIVWDRDDPAARVAESLTWIDGFHSAMAPFATAGEYQNFIDARESNWASAYYGTNLPRLVEVKRKYDPDNVFQFPQSIPIHL